jgi:zinc transport system ATP-binding protein
MSKENAVKVEHVSFAYQEEPVLQDVSFHVLPGEFMGIIGPNGGGKTTLLKLLMNLLTPLSGKITILGSPNTSAIQHIAYVPQSARFDKQFPISVLEIVLMGRLSHLKWHGCYSREDRLAAREALHKVGLSDHEQRAFGTLSGGQAQRVLIARALVSEPKLLILDEPTASVDTQAQADIYALLKQLSGGITILMVTHDLKVAITYVDKVICVQRHVFTLKPEEVCEHFAFGLYHTPLISR